MKKFIPSQLFLLTLGVATLLALFALFALFASLFSFANAEGIRECETAKIHIEKYGENMTEKDKEKNPTFQKSCLDHFNIELH